jgi:non-ribosomal peptide synthetase component F
VAMLGVLKAGGAFVPFDPMHPTPRLRSLLRSIDGKIMLCSRNREEALNTVVENLISLDEQLLDSISLPPGRNIRSGVKSTNAAYLIFTSGSTGQPKVRFPTTLCLGCLTLFREPYLSIERLSRALPYSPHAWT